MTREQAINVIEQALNVSNKAGVFNLSDSAIINAALNVFKQEFNMQGESNINSEESIKQVAKKATVKMAGKNE